MSGTLGGIYNSVTWAITEHSQALANLQEQASTGRRVNRVSDAPADSHRIMELKSQHRQKESYISGINDIYNFLDISSSVLENMSTKATNAREILTSVLSAIHTSNPETRNNAADGIDMILEDMVTMANWSHRDQYIFGGANSTQPPYQVIREDGKIAHVVYQGSNEQRMVEVNEGMELAMNTVGEDIFKMNNRGQTHFYGSTGAAAGTGTSTIEGNVWLDVETIAGGYRLSIDGGQSWTNVAVPPGDTNTAVTSSETGKVLYVDTTGITSAGTNAAKVDGTYDIFSQMIEIRDLLKNTKNLNNTDLQALTESAIKDFESLHETLTNGFTLLGTKLGSLDSIKESLENAKFDAEEGINSLEEADIAQISTDLARRETLYEMSLMVAAKLFKLSILNYIS